MKRLLPVMLAAALCASAIAQVYDGLIYSDRTWQNGQGVIPGGSASVELAGGVFSGEFRVFDPYYPLERIRAWPDGEVYRFIWLDRYTSRAEGWFTVNSAGPAMVWDMRVVSNYYGFPDRLTAVFVRR